MPDHPANWQESLRRFVQPLSPQTAGRVAGDNAVALYRVGSASS